jgi:KUP system potassium uptake protein
VAASDAIPAQSRTVQQALYSSETLFLFLLRISDWFPQISFAFFAYPALIMAYLGQGAQLITNGEVVIQNVFYATIPGGAGSGMYWFVLFIHRTT